MAWIELHDTLPDHPKTLATSEALKIDKDLLVGKLCRLWTWCLNQRENGMIADYEIGTVAEVMRWSKKPALLISALCAVPTGYEHGFLERVDGGYIIHDWDERVEMLMEKREEKRSKTRGRVQKHRAKKKANSDSCNAATEESQRECNAENAECNALQGRYVTSDVTQSNAATVPKPYLNRTKPKEPGGGGGARACARGPQDAGIPDWTGDGGEYLAEHLPEMTPGNWAELHELAGRLGGDGEMLRLAVDEAAAFRHMNWAYIRGILTRWASEGITTPEQARAERRPHAVSGKPASPRAAPAVDPRIEALERMKERELE